MDSGDHGDTGDQGSGVGTGDHDSAVGLGGQSSAPAGDHGAANVEALDSTTTSHVEGNTEVISFSGGSESVGDFVSVGTGDHASSTGTSDHDATIGSGDHSSAADGGDHGA